MNGLTDLPRLRIRMSESLRTAERTTDVMMLLYLLLVIYEPSIFSISGFDLIVARP